MAIFNDANMDILSVREHGRQLDLLRAQPALALKGSQAPHDRRAVRPVHGPGTYRPVPATDSQMTEPLTAR